MMRSVLYRLFTRIAAWFASPADLPPPSDAEKLAMAIIADFQPVLDKLNALPAKIAQEKTDAVNAAEAAHAQDVSDTVTALNTAADAATAA